MPILLFASTPEFLASNACGPSGARVLIEVSTIVRKSIESMAAGHEACMNDARLPALRALHEADLYSSDLKLLIRAIEQDGRVFVRFL